MTRIVAVTVLVVMVVVVLAGGGVASAQSTGGGTLPNGTTVNFDKLYIHEDGAKVADLPKRDPESLWNYFNLAHCQCSRGRIQGDARIPSDFVEDSFQYLVLASGSTAPITEPLNIWVGASCNTDSTTRSTMCHPIKDQAPTISNIQATNDVRVTIPIYDAMTPEPTGGDCLQRVLSATIWGLADSSIGSGLLDYSTTKSFTTDSQPPPLPTDFNAAGGDTAIVISWKPPVDASDVQAYQALCSRVKDGSAIRPTDHPSRGYLTAKGLCNLDGITLTPVDIPAVAGAEPPTPIPTVPAELADLDESFLCGENLSPTASSLRIEGLENGQAYKIALLVMDKFQNPAGVFFTSSITPVPSIDFWEDLHDRGSKAEGGLCLLAETYGDDSPLTQALRAFRDDTLGGSSAGRWLTRAYYATAAKLGAQVHGSLALRIVSAIVLAPLVAIALLWHVLSLPGLLGMVVLAWWFTRRRTARRRWMAGLMQLRAVRVAAALAVIALGAGHSHAGGYQPYWEDSNVNGDDQQSLADEPGLVKWHVGLRLGPYVPDIDNQLGGSSPGPYEQMFGGYRVLPMLDVDRILWSGFGQVGVGLSAGYFRKTAHTFAEDSMSSDGTRTKSSADTNEFLLIPTELTATYRFTWLDDEYGVPLVPYVRGGLAYYVWWISTPNGFARACTDGTMDPGCDTTKALGASLGLRGAIGLAVRAERVDRSAAVSMRQSGLLHAGLYAELSLAKVDGFGSDTKLSVGDRTWFAGVDFEF